MDTSTIVNLGKKYLKGKVALKAGKALISKRAGFIGLGAAAAAGAGYWAYNYFNSKKKPDLTRIDNIEDNNHDVEGDKKIVV